MSRRLEGFTWLALLVAGSSALGELVRSFAREHLTQTALLTPLLLGWCMLRVGGTWTPGRDGLALVALGLALELTGVATASLSLALLGLPLAALGLARVHGRPSPAVMALAFWIVPIPGFVFSLTTPGLESALLDLASGAMGWMGFDVAHTGPVARHAGERLELYGYDSGVVAAAVLAQIGWFDGVRAGASASGLVARAARFACAALVIQPLAIVAALALLRWQSGDAARLWLTNGVWLTAAAGAITYSFARPSRRGAGRSR